MPFNPGNVRKVNALGGKRPQATGIVLIPKNAGNTLATSNGSTANYGGNTKFGLYPSVGMSYLFENKYLSGSMFNAQVEPGKIVALSTGPDPTVNNQDYIVSVTEYFDGDFSTSEKKFNIPIPDGGSGREAPSLMLVRGATYTFDQSHSSNDGHQIQISATPTGSNVVYATTVGTLGSDSVTTLVVPLSAPDTLYYNCAQHGAGMGKVISIINAGHPVITDTYGYSPVSDDMAGWDTTGFFAFSSTGVTWSLSSTETTLPVQFLIDDDAPTSDTVEVGMAFSPDHATNEVHSFSITATANGKSSTMGPIDIEIIDQTSPLINSSQLLTSISIGGTNLGQVSANENVTWYFDSGGTDKTVDADGNVTLTAGASWINGVEDYVLRAEDDEGASTTTDVISVEVGTWNKIGLDIDGEAADDESGHSVSLSGDGSVVAIGAPYNSGVSGANSGHVRVYRKSGTTWYQKGQEIDGAAENDYSGWSVSLNSNGSIVAIGSLTGDDGTNDTGHVRVYEYLGTTWQQKGSTIPGDNNIDYFGQSVSLSSNGLTLAIGANKNDDNGNNSGHVKIYEYNNNDWSQIGADIGGEAANDESGHSVSLNSNGSIVAIGAPLRSDDKINQGDVRVYKKVSVRINGGGSLPLNTWSPSPEPGTLYDIDIYSYYDPNNMNVPHEALNTNDVIIFENGAKLTLTEPAAEGATSLTGNLVGDSGSQSLGEADNGCAWTRLSDDGELTGGRDDAETGYSVSLSGDGSVVAIGSKANGGNIDGPQNNRGHVRVFEYNNTYGAYGWNQIGLDIDGEAAGDQLGRSVSLSSDGTILAIGAPYTDSGDASASGRVRVFRKIGNSWSQIGSNIDGEAAGDQSGWSVSLSRDGDKLTVAIGAVKNDAGINNPDADIGHVRVYELV